MQLQNRSFVAKFVVCFREAAIGWISLQYTKQYTKVEQKLSLQYSYIAK